MPAMWKKHIPGKGVFEICGGEELYSGGTAPVVPAVYR
jgi:hypothetical protein